jgi:hypothetical protein
MGVIGAEAIGRVQNPHLLFTVARHVEERFKGLARAGKKVGLVELVPPGSARPSSLHENVLETSKLQHSSSREAPIFNLQTSKPRAGGAFLNQ